MAKLIYSQAAFKDVCGSGKLLEEALNTDQSKNSYYRSILITNDAYFVTHGRKFKMVDVDSKLINVTLTESNGVVTLTDTVTSAYTTFKLPVYTLTEGDGIKLTNTEGSWKISQATPEQADDDETFGVTYNNGTISIGSGTYDKLGRISSYTKGNSYNIDHVILSLESENTFYLLGSTESKATTGATVKNSNVYISFDSNGVPLLNVTKLNLKNYSSLSFSDTNNTLEAYINAKVDEAKTQALVYKGTLALGETSSTNPYEPSTTGITNGDVLKLTDNGYVRVSENSVIKVKSGDLLIAKVASDGTFTEWDLIPSGNEEETLIQYRDSILSGTLTFDGTGVSYNNRKFTFNDTTYEAFTGATPTTEGAAGLVPTPAATLENHYLAGDGNWKALPTINNGKLTLKLGADVTIANDFTANGTDKTYTIPLATLESEKDPVVGVVTGSLINVAPTSLGWTNASIVDGVVQFYNHTYSYTLNTFIDGVNTYKIGSFSMDNSSVDVNVPIADSAIEVTEGSLKKVFGIVGTTSTETDPSKYFASPIIDGVVYYQNTWRPIYAYSATSESATELWKSSEGATALEFSSDFIAINTDSTRGEEIYITWAEVSEDGKTITYNH